MIFFGGFAVLFWTMIIAVTMIPTAALSIMHVLVKTDTVDCLHLPSYGMYVGRNENRQGLPPSLPTALLLFPSSSLSPSFSPSLLLSFSSPLPPSLSPSFSSSHLLSLLLSSSSLPASVFSYCQVTVGQPSMISKAQKLSVFGSSQIYIPLLSRVRNVSPNTTSVGLSSK